jgi:putative phosphotransacetylase
MEAPARAGGPPHPLVVNVSARHMHVTPEDLGVLFGAGSKLTKLKDLYQAGEFASEQTVTLVGPRQRVIPNVRILGPERKFTQIELSYTDGVYLGLDLPLRVSGDIEGTSGITVLGPKGALQLQKGVIRAARHVHMSTEDMDYYGVKDGDLMRLRVTGPCGATFDNLKVRYHPKVILEVHIDTDEGNACDLESATNLELIRQ